MVKQPSIICHNHDVSGTNYDRHMPTYNCSELTQVCRFRLKKNSIGLRGQRLFLGFDTLGLKKGDGIGCVLRLRVRCSWFVERLLLLFKHSAKSSNAQEQRLATLPYLVTRLYLSHVKVARFHVLKINVVIPTPETEGTVGVWAVAYPCR